MKTTLLASASLLAVTLAGAAAAESHEGISFSGSATLGYNDVIENGFYWSGDLSVSMVRMLNNGLEAGGSFTLLIADNNTGNEDIDVDGDWDFYVKSDSAGIYFGDVDQATEVYWSGIDGMEADGFDEDGIGAAILRAEVTVGPVMAALSYNIDADEGGDGLSGMQFAADAAFGNFNVGVAYQDDSFTGEEIIGVSAGATLGAADVALAYADNGIEDSIGVSVSYPAGPVTLGVYFATNSVSGDAYGITAAYANGPITVDASYEVGAGADDGEFGVEATYDVGNGMKIWVGALENGDEVYAAVTMDLGGDASLLVSYADDGDDANDDDEVGEPELLEGMTAELSLSF